MLRSSECAAKAHCFTSIGDARKMGHRFLRIGLIALLVVIVQATRVLAGTTGAISGHYNQPPSTAFEQYKLFRQDLAPLGAENSWPIGFMSTTQMKL